MAPTAPTAEPRYLGAAEVKRRLSVSDCSLWRWIREGKFPQPSYFGSRRRWLEADIVSWELERRGPPSRPV